VQKALTDGDVIAVVFSPKGLNNLAQGRAPRLPGYATTRNANCPEGHSGRNLCAAIQISMALTDGSF